MLLMTVVHNPIIFLHNHLHKDRIEPESRCTIVGSRSGYFFRPSLVQSHYIRLISPGIFGYLLYVAIHAERYLRRRAETVLEFVVKSADWG